MDNITFTQSNCKEETTSIWLISVMNYGLKMGIYKPFENFKLKMKEVKYSVYQKLITIIASIVIGCEFMKDINEKLNAETTTANMFNMERFPDQSQINRLLSRMDEESIEQLSKIHHQLFKSNSLTQNPDDEVVIDFDQSGIVANGKTYELAVKGYFVKKKNQRGYQVSAAFAGQTSETVTMFLDSGDTHCGERFDDLLSATLSKFSEHLRMGNLIIRDDSGYGSKDKIDRMLSVPNLKFITKAYSTRQAANLATGIDYSEYIQVASAAWVYELPSDTGLRKIIVQILTEKGEIKYTMLITNISKSRMSAEELFHFYNKRQTIEAFFKTSKNIYSIKNLRTRKFYGIYSFLWLVFITHNIITWFRATAFAGTQLENVGLKDLIKNTSDIKATVKRTTKGIEIVIPTLSKLSKLIAEALTRQRYKQLSFW